MAGSLCVTLGRVEDRSPMNAMFVSQSETLRVSILHAICIGERGIQVRREQLLYTSSKRHPPSSLIGRPTPAKEQGRAQARENPPQEDRKMKLISYHSEQAMRPGLLVDSKVFDLNTLLTSAGLSDGPQLGSVRQFLERHGDDLAGVGAKLDTAAGSGVAIGTLDAVRLGPPITDPSKVLCIGLNYRDHVEETGKQLPAAPEIFPKFASTLIGPFDDIACSTVSSNLDFEGELAIVIGQRCRNVSGAQALAAVAGLMVLNDTTARDLQYRGTQFLPGKAIDASTPCGPALVTLDEIHDPHSLDISTKVNGMEMQRSNTRHLIFRVEDLVEDISRLLELAPGDIISTGTPGGIGAKRQPPVYLAPGDVVEVEVGSVGTIRSVIA